MNRIELVGLFVFSAVVLIVDIWFAVSRCAQSPSLHLSALAIGLVLQVTAVSAPLIVNRYFSDQTPAHRSKMMGIAALLCFISLPIMETALLYGDAIGQAKWFASAGLGCRTHAPWFSNGT